MLTDLNLLLRALPIMNCGIIKKLSGLGLCGQCKSADRKPIQNRRMILPTWTIMHFRLIAISYVQLISSDRVRFLSQYGDAGLPEGVSDI